MYIQLYSSQFYPRLRSGAEINFKEEKNGIFAINAGTKDIRRLSTKSSVLARPGEKDLTEWKWYWKEKDGDWREYESYVSYFIVNTVILILVRLLN